MAVEVGWRKFPKNFRSSATVKSNADVQRDATALCCGVNTHPDGDILIYVHAKPGAKVNNVSDIAAEQIGIQIAAPPVDGEANKELIKYISQVLGVSKSSIMLQKGAKSRDKCLSVTMSSLTVEEVIQKLKTEMDNGL